MHREHNHRFSIHKGRRPLALDIPPTSVPCLLSPLHTTVALDTPTLYLALRKDYEAPTSEIMLHLSLARDEHARQASRHVFDPSYSPDHSECSYSSQKYTRSRSPSPVRQSSPVRRMPRSNTVSHPRSVTHHTLPRSHTHPSDLSSVGQCHIFRRPSRSGNEEVLRSRLEGVLSSAPGSRDVSCPPSPTRRRGESFGLITPPHGTLPAMTRSATSPAISRASPLTPPPSPPFDANRVALQLKDREGYVSFADVQGLGMPSDDDQDTCDPERGRARWWSIFKA